MAFDLVLSSRRHLNYRYGHERMVEEVAMDGVGYETTQYIYAVADVMVPTMDPSTSGWALWIDYVAVSTDDMTE